MQIIASLVSYSSSGIVLEANMRKLDIHPQSLVSAHRCGGHGG